uniref:G-protein coupled receptors family 2 profile 2 domain-containing protein n=1 Tax=Anopheles coluzzii TaxID=1518534 RepID=A0A8W7PBT7_ANOCL
MPSSTRNRYLNGLRNNRTRIHKNLFVAMVIQVVIRLTVYIDQAIIRSGGKKGNESSRQGIDNTLNFIFLLNIIRVLIVKLRQSHTSDVEQVRKAVRAAVVLVPLLGITNILNMTQAPLDKTALEFAIWSYVTHFLSSFQGFFIALLYCFLNGEVRTALMKSISVYLSLRGHHDWAIRRQSLFSAGYPTAPINETPHAGEPQRTPNTNNNNNNNNNSSRNAASNNLLAGAASSNNHHTANGGMAGGNANGFRCGWFSRCFLNQRVMAAGGTRPK